MVGDDRLLGTRARQVWLWDSLSDEALARVATETRRDLALSVSGGDDDDDNDETSDALMAAFARVRGGLGTCARASPMSAKTIAWREDSAALAATLAESLRLLKGSGPGNVTYAILGLRCLRSLLRDRLVLNAPSLGPTWRKALQTVADDAVKHASQGGTKCRAAAETERWGLLAALLDAPGRLGSRPHEDVSVDPWHVADALDGAGTGPPRGLKPREELASRGLKPREGPALPEGA